VWVTDRQDLPNTLTYYDPAGLSGWVTIGTSDYPRFGGLVTGPDHGLWIADADGAIHRFDPTMPGALTTYSINNSTPALIAVGPDGALWFSDPGRNVIGRITTAGATSSFPIPTPASGVQGIAAGPDGNVWFTESDADQIGRLTPAGTVTEFAVPTPQSAPQQIVAGSDGALWFTERDANQIGRITTAGAVSELPIPTSGSTPVGIAAGPDSAVWFTETTGHAIGRVTTDGVIKEYPVGSYSDEPFSITAGADGDLWFTLPNGFPYTMGGQVGRLTPESKPLCRLAFASPIALTCASPSQTMTVSNAGATSCGTLAVMLDASNPMSSVFQLGGTCAGNTLDSGASCTITASIDPMPNATSDYDVIVKLQPGSGDLYEPAVQFTHCR
jgi:virginiamycin B lyase